MNNYLSFFIILLFFLFLQGLTLNKFIYADQVSFYYYSEEELNNIDKIISDNKNWENDSQIKESLNNLSNLIGYEIGLSYNSIKPDGYISEYDNLVKHIHKLRLFVYSKIKSHMGSTRINSIYNKLKEISDNDDYEIFYGCYSILSDQMCIPKAESDLELFIDKNNYKKQIGSALLLGKACNPVSIKYLKLILSGSPSLSMKIDAASSLLAMNNEQGREYFRESLIGQKNQLIHEVAIRNLAGKGSLDDIDFLIDEILYKREIYDELIANCYWYISINSPRLTSVQKKKLFDYFNDIKADLFRNDEELEFYINSLYNLGGKEAAEKLIEFLQFIKIDKNELIKSISLLGFLQKKEYLPYVIPFLQSNDTTIRDYTLLSIENMLSEDENSITKDQMFNIYPDREKHYNNTLKWWNNYKNNMTDKLKVDVGSLEKINLVVQKFSSQRKK